MAPTKTKTLSLDLPVAALKGDLVTVPAQADTVVIQPDPELDPQLDQISTDFVKAALEIDPNDPNARLEYTGEVGTMGLDLQKASAHKSRMLEKPIKELASKGEDGGEVANALVSLKTQVEELNPNDLDFNASGIARLVSKIPGVGTNLQRYFLRYESAQGLIDEILRSLEAGQQMLRHDNVTLQEDQAALRQMTIALERQCQLALAIDRKMSAAVDGLPEGDQKRFLMDELLFPLRQRVLDLQQQLGVNQNGVLAMELVIRNNNELIRGVDRALTVTVSALSVAVTVAMAVANQKIVLDKINALNKVTGDLIAGTASRLRTQGVEVQKQASSAMLDIDTLKAAFTDIVGAMDEISEYRSQALPGMAQQILELHDLNNRGEAAIARMEEGNKQRPAMLAQTEG